MSAPDAAGSSPLAVLRLVARVLALERCAAPRGSLPVGVPLLLVARR